MKSTLLRHGLAAAILLTSFSLTGCTAGSGNPFFKQKPLNAGVESFADQELGTMDLPAVYSEFASKRKESTESVKAESRLAPSWLGSRTARARDCAGSS